MTIAFKSCIAAPSVHGAAGRATGRRDVDDARAPTYNPPPCFDNPSSS